MAVAPVILADDEASVVAAALTNLPVPYPIVEPATIVLSGAETVEPEGLAMVKRVVQLVGSPACSN